MFWLDIPGGLAVLIVVVVLVHALIEKIVDKIKESRQIKKDLKGRKVYEAYLKIQALKPEERVPFLDSQPRSFRRLYLKGVNYWGEPK